MADGRGDLSVVSAAPHSAGLFSLLLHDLAGPFPGPRDGSAVQLRRRCEQPTIPYAGILQAVVSALPRRVRHYRLRRGRVLKMLANVTTSR